MLNSSAEHGNTWLPYKQLSKRVINLLARNKHALDRGEVAHYLNYWKKYFYFTPENFNENSLITTPELYRTEKFIFNTVKKYNTLPSPYKDFKFEECEDLSDEQNKAIENLIISPGRFAILTGGPGTGKTSILKELIKQFLENYPTYPVQVISPTGKAAKRVKEVMGDMDINASTMHKFLNIDADGNITDVSDDTLTRTKTIQLLIIEESSMADLPIFRLILDALDIMNVKVILVGDTNQLPSVGAGDLLRDLIDLNIHVEKLTKSFRFIGTIANNADKVNNGDSELEVSDTFEIIKASEEDILSKISSIDADCFITPYRSESHLISTSVINNIVQSKRINECPAINNGYKFRINDSIIFTRTSYAIAYK